MRAHTASIVIISLISALMSSWPTTVDAASPKEPNSEDALQKASTDEMKAQGASDAYDIASENVVKRIERMKREANKDAKEAKAHKKKKYKDKGYFRNGEFVKHMSIAAAVTVVGLVVLAFQDELDETSEKKKEKKNQ